MDRNQRHGQRGVSLIETMLALTIAAVLGTASVPAMSGALERQRLGATTNDFVASLNLARSEAVRRGSAVAVTPADGASWASGWMVFADDDDDGKRDAGEQVLLERPRGMHGATATAHFGATYSGVVLSYSPLGYLHRPGANRLVVGRVVIRREQEARSICFASIGFRVTSGAACS